MNRRIAGGFLFSKTRRVMKLLETILMIIGAAFIAIGGVISIIFIAAFGGVDVFVLIPFLFVLIGLAFVISVFVMRYKSNIIKKRGTKYSGKIYGYVKNTSVVVNGQFTSDTKVHYFDNNGIEREAILPTGFSEGSSKYPIGMTIDIYELNGKYNFDSNSVRNEILPREAELMDDKPIDPGLINVVAVTCPACGASFEAAKGYSNKCPYCGGYINA